MTRLARYAWTVLAVNLGVILWGAVVRATGSGAGCGSHWPLCDGVVVPRSPSFSTLVEFTHRASSGVALLAVVVLFVWAWRSSPAGAAVRRAALWSLVFILVEAAIGAGLVLFGLVGSNASWLRAAYLAVHLCNTFLLLAALALTAFLADRGSAAAAGASTAPKWGSVVLGLLLVAGATGSVAALGDTLATSASAADVVTGILLRLRIVHPVVAVAAAALALRLVSELRRRGSSATALSLLVYAQLAAGVVNVMLLAPLWMQLVHLLLADLVWIAAVLAIAAVRYPSRREAT